VAVVKRSERRKNPFREKKRFDVTDFASNNKTEADEADEDEEEQDIVVDKAKLVDMED
jgi:tRNA pseudouridine38-40 synthase